MPARNSIKTYVSNGFYHVYNRGVEKRKIFIGRQDFGVFLGYLKEYLTMKDESTLRATIGSSTADAKDKDRAGKLLRLNNFSGDIELNCFTLKPNHFHFLLKQKEAESMDKFMNSLCTRYTMYFNKKYKRVGGLFQGVYKAVLVDSLEYLLYLSKYIHLQSIEKKVQRPSSLNTYLGKQSIGWVCRDTILDYFSKHNPQLTYESFLGNKIMPASRSFSKLLIE